MTFPWCPSCPLWLTSLLGTQKAVRHGEREGHKDSRIGTIKSSCDEKKILSGLTGPSRDARLRVWVDTASSSRVRGGQRGSARRYSARARTWTSESAPALCRRRTCAA